MKYLITIVVCVLLALGLMAYAAFAADACGSREKIVKVLADKYQEQGTALGLANEEMVVELFSSKDGATWTLLLSSTNGNSCIVSSGKDWMTKAPAILGKDS